MDAILAHPAYLSWRAAALAEPWTIPDYAAGHTLIESFI
jgi:glutathione S-transferase